jgi:integrase
MPKKYVMNWQQDKSRWRKMHRGQWFFVTPKELGCRPTKEASWKAANEWWARKLATLAAPVLDPANFQVRRVLESRDTVREAVEYLCVQMQKGEAAKKLLQLLTAADEHRLPDDADGTPDALQAAERLMKGEPIDPRLIQLMLGHGGFVPVSYEQTTEKLKRLADEVTAEPPVDPDRGLHHHYEQWCRIQLGADKSAARKKMNMHMLGFFKRFMGDVEVDEVNEARWAAFYTWLRGKDLDDGYKGRILRTAKNFVRYLYEMRLIELPRNLDSRLLAFKSRRKEVKPLAVDVLRRFYGAAVGQTKLHVLLMLNCGMTAQDVSDLRDDEVDWDGGSLTRKRGKTRDHEDVPKVRYQLWPACFRLLKEYRSGKPNVLLTKTGNPWIRGKIEGDDYQHSDSIASRFKGVCRKAKVKVTPKQLRTTAASKLGEHENFKFYAQYFLGHSPRTVADKHYVKPSDEEFAKALKWLGDQFGLGD